MKIWNQSSKDKNTAIDDFLSSEDIVLDQELFLYDIEASIAHAHELENINILTKSETKKVIVSLKKLAKLFLAKKFKLTSKYEDCHTAIEDYLTKELGSVGKKIHTGRSRNDQVMVAMRLYGRAKLDEIQSLNLKIAQSFFDKAEKHSSDPMPGYTHLQRAMPSTWGLWFGAFAESFLDNADLLSGTQTWMNINPLGSAAGYGVNLPIKRDISTKELNFKRKQLNTLYVQNSRGKFELELIGSLKQPMLDVRKFSWDMSIFLTQEFSLLSIASKYSQWVIMGGLVLAATTAFGNTLLLVGIIMFAMGTLFSFITLPVEYDASNRALAWLERENIVTQQELSGSKDALKWAARTYVVAAVGSLATLLYFISIYLGRD